MPKIVAIASFPELMDAIDADSILDYRERFIGIDWLHYFMLRAKKAGIKVISARRAVQVGDYNATLIADNFGVDQYSRFFSKRAILICAESPIIAKTFFMRLKHWTSRFSVTYTWEGALELDDCESGRLRLLRWPYNHDQGLHEGRDHDKIPIDRKHRMIVAFASNKSYSVLHPLSIDSLSGLYWSIRSNIESIIFHYVYRRFKKVRELYSLRRSTIDYFLEKKIISLYGLGWTTTSLDYKDYIESKSDVKNKYVFCLCLENCIFPGYLTEKIFDAIRIGAIPVWCGSAPTDLREMIGKIAVELTGTESPAEIFRKLETISTERLQELKRQGQTGLIGARNLGYCAEHFADQVLRDLTSIKF